MDTLRKLRLFEPLRTKIVKGASIAQAFQFVDTGAAEVGFVALAQVMARPGGSRWLVPATLHAPIEQQAILLTPSADELAARSFMAFLKGPEARSVIRRYGYEVR